MGLETGTYVSDLVTTNPPTSDLVAQGDDHLRLIKTVLKNTLPNATKALYFPTAATKTTNYSVLSTDMNKFLVGNGAAGAVQFTLPSLASGDDGWQVFFQASSVTNPVTIIPPSGTIDGASSITLLLRQMVRIIWDGSAFHSDVNNIVDIVNLTALTAPAIDDSLIIYDLSATANRKITTNDLWRIINLLTAETAPALDDVFAMYDTSEGAPNKMQFQDYLKVLNALTEDTAPDIGADFLLTYDTSASGPKKVKPISLMQVACYQEQQAANTNTSTALSGGNFVTCVLNTEVYDTIGITLSSNVLSVPAGTYEVHAYFSGNEASSGGVKLRLRNTSDSTNLVIGQSQRGDTDGTAGTAVGEGLAALMGIFTIAATKNVELQYRGPNATKFASNAGETEIYANILLKRIA